MVSVSIAWVAAKRSCPGLAAAWLALAPVGLGSQGKPPGGVRLRWPPVSGALGYAVEVDGGREKLVRRVSEPSILLELEPGAYRFRLASIGVDGRPGPWSAWKPLEVFAATEAVPETKTRTGQHFMVSGPFSLIPGVPQWQAGNRLRAAALGGGFLLGLGAGAYGAWEGSSAANAAEDRPRYRLFNDTLLLAAFASSNDLDFTALALYATGLQEHRRFERRYESRQRLSAVGYVIALLFYAVHLGDLNILPKLTLDGRPYGSERQPESFAKSSEPANLEVGLTWSF